MWKMLLAEIQCGRQSSQMATMISTFWWWTLDNPTLPLLILGRTYYFLLSSRIWQRWRDTTALTRLHYIAKVKGCHAYDCAKLYVRLSSKNGARDSPSCLGEASSSALDCLRRGTHGRELQVAPEIWGPSTKITKKWILPTTCTGLEAYVFLQQDPTWAHSPAYSSWLQLCKILSWTSSYITPRLQTQGNWDNKYALLIATKFVVIYYTAIDN